MPPNPEDEENPLEPVLNYKEDSEIAAAVDVTLLGPDSILRPVYINQDEEILQLTLEDAKRLSKFLKRAIKFVEDYEKRIIQ